jgi:hypothetical protein
VVGRRPTVFKTVEALPMKVVTKQKYNELKSVYPSMIPAGDEKKSAGSAATAPA